MFIVVEIMFLCPSTGDLLIQSLRECSGEKLFQANTPWLQHARAECPANAMRKSAKCGIHWGFSVSRIYPEVGGW